ncbi:peptidase S1 [Marinicauda salina]|uniref:Peptidase S1 n=1 Tax=Marinicauda salina TaxID=2135793 RepID=A0A2U2BSC9_9PROT|nr:peptidase S1 [Marinicauda salina]
MGRTAGGSTAAAQSGPDWSRPARYGDISLSSGFRSDPRRVSVVSGGRNRASDTASGCRGWVATAPDVQLTYQAGSVLPLILSVDSTSDTTLLVNDPNGRWHCDDDGGNDGLNPALTFSEPLSGVYDIWIGSYRQGENAQATLSISELYSE